MNSHTAIVCAALLVGSAAGERFESSDVAAGTTGTLCCVDKDLNLKAAQTAVARVSQTLSKFTLGAWLGFDKTTNPCDLDERFKPMLIETFKGATLNCGLESLVVYKKTSAAGDDAADLPRTPYKDLADPAIKRKVIEQLLPEGVLEMKTVQALVAEVSGTYEYRLGNCASPGACLDVFLRSAQVAADARACQEARALLGSRMAAFSSFSTCSAHGSCGKYEFGHAAKYGASAADKANFKLWATLDMMIVRSDLCEAQGEGAVRGADLIKALDMKGGKAGELPGARLQLLGERLKKDEACADAE